MDHMSESFHRGENISCKRVVKLILQISLLTLGIGNDGVPSKSSSDAQGRSGYTTGQCDYGDDRLGKGEQSEQDQVK